MVDAQTGSRIKAQTRKATTAREQLRKRAYDKAMDCHR